jgi:tetratricopeptide (TPR) repeat protein
VAARVRASAVREEVVAALDAWAGITWDGPRRAWLLAVARAADPDPGRDRLRQPALWRDPAAQARLAEGASAAGLSPQLAATLAGALGRSGVDAVPLLRAAQARHPDDFWLNFQLGVEFSRAKEWDEAVAHFRAALALRPRAGAVHNNLGLALAAKGRRDEAIGHYEEALRIAPKYAQAHYSLGNALAAEGRRDEAIGRYEEALRLDPKFAMAHVNLGRSLHAKGRRDEAVHHYEEALRIAPKLAEAHVNLGASLFDKGKLDAAVSHLEEALRIAPKDAIAHFNLGNALNARGRPGEAIDQWEQALRLDPTLALAHVNLGLAHSVRGRREEAIRHYRQALRLDPKLALAHVNLGAALRAQGRVEEAIGHFERAVGLAPKYAPAHGALGQALLAQGRWADARDATRRCLGLLPSRHPLRPTVLQQLQQCERMLALESRLPAVLAGKDRPAGAAERLQFADLCGATKRHAAAVSLYADAFAADPKLAHDLQAGHRYNAACAATLAAAGRGTDAGKLDDKERARLRQQALDWLRADLARWDKRAEGGTPQARAAVQQTLYHWQQDADLAGVRDKPALAALPAAERADWEKLWTDVADLLHRLDKKAAVPAGK